MRKVSMMPETVQIERQQHDDHEENDEEIRGWKSHSDLLSADSFLFVKLIPKFDSHYTPAKWVDFSLYFMTFTLAGCTCCFKCYEIIEDKKSGP